MSLIEVPDIRRFDLADLSRHGKWLVPRLVQALGLPEQRLAGWLRGLIDSREFLFLTNAHSCALAEVQLVNGLADKPVVRERFVFVEDPENKDYIEEAADFYDEFHRWAKSLGAEIMLVEELTIVPHEMIKQKLGRVFTREQRFARI